VFKNNKNNKKFLIYPKGYDIDIIKEGGKDARK